MSKVIIVCGLPGSGKTTLAEALSKKLNIVCLHKDMFKEYLYELQDLTTLEETKALGKQVSELVRRVAEEQIKRGVDVIIELPLNFPEDYPILQKWIDIYNVALYTIICAIDDDTRLERYRKRITTTRHHAHHDGTRVKTLDGFYIGGQEVYTTIPGKQIHITTDQPTEDLLKKVINNID